MGTDWLEWIETGKRASSEAWQDFEDRISLLEAGGGPGGGALKYSELIGNGVADIWSVTHNFNTIEVIVQVFEVSTGAQVFPGVRLDDPDTVEITFSANNTPALDQYRVTVIG